jgi:hypothetical protein
MKRQKIFKEVTPEEEKEIKENLLRNPVTKKDTWAMIIAALIILVPALIIVIGIFLAVIWFFFMR